MKILVACDKCGCELKPQDSFYDIGSEMEFCELHYLEVQIHNAVREKNEFIGQTQRIWRDKISPLEKILEELRSQIEQMGDR